jgi:hypothetical protein
VFEKKVLTRIFGPKTVEVAGSWRKLHNEELHNLFSSPSIIRLIKSRRMRWVQHTARMGEKRNACVIGQRPLGRTRGRLLATIKMDLREIRWGGMDWIDLVEDRVQWRPLVNAVMNLRVP